MKQTRNKHSPAAKVTLATIAQLASRFEVHPSQFTPGKGPWWKEPRSYLEIPAEINHLYRHIGQ